MRQVVAGVAKQQREARAAGKENEMYFDSLYLLLVIPAMIFALIMDGLVKSRYKKYSKVAAASGMSGFEAARAVLDANGLRHVAIKVIGGNLTDNYNPKEEVLSLSNGVANTASIAAVSIACHEAGHAIQHAQGYAPAKFRLALVPITSVTSRICIPLIIIGLIFGGLSRIFILFAYIGVIFFAIATFFQLVTLPVEFDASRRAMAVMEGQGVLATSELPDAKKMLSAAAMTYVAALAVSIMQLLRFIALLGGGGRRR